MQPLALIPLAALVALSGCDFIQGPEEVRACEAFIKGQLRSPSTYQQAEVLVGSDEPLSQMEFHRLYIGDAPDRLAEIMKLGTEGKQLSLRRVFIHYDADNAYGTPVRGLSSCEFLVVDGKLDGKGYLESRADSAASELKLRELTQQLGNPELNQLSRRHGESTSECCVRY